MKTNIYKIIAMLLALMVTPSGCNEQEIINESKEEFCLFVNEKNFGKIIPFINEFLAGLSNDLDDEQKLQECVAWLNAQPCNIYANIMCQSCVENDPPISQIVISFKENEDVKIFDLAVSMSNPLKALGYREHGRDYGGELPFIICPCSHERNFLFDPQPFSQLEAYLFRGSVPFDIRPFQIDFNYGSCFIEYVDVLKQAYIVIYSPEYRYPFIGPICNFPDFAQEWATNDIDCKIDIEGVFYDACTYISRGWQNIDYVLTKIEFKTYIPKENSY